MSRAARRLRVFMYAQHMSGVGHYVRSLEIARALTEAQHEVHITDGGQPVPHRTVPEIAFVELPRVFHAAGLLAPLEPQQPLDEVMITRRTQLRQAVTALCPDVLVIEHYPFGKWELGEEIAVLIAAARAALPKVRVVCSVRDIPPQTSHQALSPEVYASEVLARLHHGFDAVMVHADVRLTRLDEHFPGTHKIRLPVEHTGIVSEPPVEDPEKTREIVRHTGGRPYVLVSAGGGPDHASLFPHSVDAWRWLQSRGKLEGWKLVLCGGLGLASCEALSQQLGERAEGPAVLLRPFSTAFLHWMRGAELSISCAGYNTCANLLESRCRALLVPNPKMSDQPLRAALLAEKGIAKVVSPAALDHVTLAKAMLRSLSAERPRHAITLNGAEASCAYVQRLVG